MPSGTTILAEHAVVDGFVFHRRLVGLDLGDHIAGLDRVAFLLEPFGEVALLIVGDSAGIRMLIGIGAALHHARQR